MRGAFCSARLSAGALVLVLLTAGAAMSGSALDQLRGAVTRPVPVVPRRDAPRPDMVWVPDRYIPAPGAPQGVDVPGHWERPTSEPEISGSPLTGFHPANGRSPAKPA